MKSIITKMTGKIREVGLKNTLKGTIKRAYFQRLQKRFGFHPWHISPYELRKYAQVTVEYVNSCVRLFDREEEVVDIGCGLGEIIRRINHEGCKTGLDLSENAIAAAKFLDRKHTVNYVVGSFDELGKGRKIACLITLGFMQGGTTDTWREPYGKITAENDIKRIIVDVLPENEEAEQHTVDFNEILDGYRQERQIGPLLGDRYVKVFVKEPV